MEEAKLRQWAKGEFKKIKMIVNEKEKQVNFVDIWIDDSNKLQKEEIVFDPNPNNDNSKTTIVLRVSIPMNRLSSFRRRK